MRSLLLKLLFVVLFLKIDSVYAQYCQPDNIGKYNTFYISNVSLGSIDNSSRGTTGDYMYYSSVPATDIMVGETITGTVTVTLDGWNKSKHTLIVWMNFNNSDADFEDSDEQFTFVVKDNSQLSGLKTINIPISIPVPSTAQLGNSVMRIGFREKQNSNFTPCDYKHKAGEVEDYSINFVSDNSSDPSGVNVDPEYSEPVNIGNWNTYYISNVNIGSIDNSGTGDTGNYTYYSSIDETDVTIGETIEGVVEVALNDWNTQANTVVVWMNFNEQSDDDFEDDGERFLFTFNGGADDNHRKKNNKTVQVPISIPIPSYVVEGNSVMRIGLREGTDTNFLSNDFKYGAGEVEDYKINFTKSTQSNDLNLSTDTDGDGVPDSVDIDDDNDGILDTDECQNILVNSGFNNRVGLNNGNNIGVDISPWILGSGDKANIVKVDGAGGYNYGNGGPFEDANPLTADGDDQYYLDIAAGSNDFYQSFVVTGNAKLTYGGYFSSRDGLTGTGRLRIFTGGSGSSGSLVADSGIFSVASLGGNSSNTPWQLFQDEFVVVAGTYSFVVSMDNHMNFDEGYTRTCYDLDNDSFYDYIDIDSDDDGIPDNVEAQPTIGYIAPSNVSSSITDVNNNGLDDVYESAIGGTDLNNLEDTDGDGVKDYLDSDTDNDGTPDIEENGQANIANGIDIDADGLHDNLDSVTGYFDINDEVTYGSVADLTTSFGDVDSDASLGGDLDYRDLFDVNPASIASIDFDGIDDYLSRESFINGLNNVTIMAWVKTDAGNSTSMVIAGEDTGCKLWLERGNTPKFTVKVTGNSEATVSSSAINFDEWHHITGIYNSETGVISIYIDGEMFGSTNVGSTGASIENTEDSNENFEIGRLSSNVVNKQYFKGDIDEVRVFDVVLTDEQVSKMVYQEIENNAGTNNVKGSIVKKDIEDTITNNIIPWNNLIAYYPMTDIKRGITIDYSGYDKKLYLNYITTIQDQTAPMPYVTSSNGTWTTESTWLHGDVWDIENTANNKEWSIVKVSSDVSACHTMKTIGLIVDSGQTLTVHSDNVVENTWYLELNGTLSLEDDSQLIQTVNSDLVTSASGKILRRQEGTSNVFRYNYWGSPVGATGVTALTDNNDVTNNNNNTAYTLNMLKDEMGINLSFTSAHNEIGKISTSWLYTYIDGLTYWDWFTLTPTTSIQSGVGYTQKGTGNAGLEQQYTFEGKPNNGTILVNVTDKGGAGSVPSVSKTEYLLGNPYPSALDIHKFIDDNIGVIDGSLLLWQQWGGNTHVLREYEGGYAQVNKLGSIRAYQFVGFEGANNGSQDGTITPSRYLSVGQGFMTEIVANGDVEFNNSQRIFIKEADAEGTYNTGSTFFKNGGGKTKNKNASAKSNEANEFKTIRLELSSVSGPATRRELLLGFSETTTDGFDYGYDAECTESNNNDFNLNFEGKNMNIQAYGDITNDKVVPLNFKSSDSNTFKIKMSDAESLDEDQDIYLRDNLTGTYFNLKENTAYSFSSEQGKFNTRFEIVFQSEQQSLSVEETKHNENFIYYQNNTNTLFAKKMNSPVSRLAVISMTGQTVLELTNVSQGTLDNGLKLSNMATGTYIACIRTEDNQVLTKKIIFN